MATGGGMEQKLGMNAHTHTPIHETDDQQDLLYSTGTSTQHCVTTSMRKESKKE